MILIIIWKEDRVDRVARRGYIYVPWREKNSDQYSFVTNSKCPFFKTDSLVFFFKKNIFVLQKKYFLFFFRNKILSFFFGIFVLFLTPFLGMIWGKQVLIWREKKFFFSKQIPPKRCPKRKKVSKKKQKFQKKIEKIFFQKNKLAFLKGVKAFFAKKTISYKKKRSLNCPF